LDEIKGILAATEAPDKAVFHGIVGGGTSSIGDVHTGGISAAHAPAVGGSSFAIQYELRRVKAYPITENELSELGTLGGFAGLFFSLASAFVGFGGNIFLDLYLSPPPSEISAGWKIGMFAVFLTAAIFVILGAILVWKRHTKIDKIKRECIF
jgi:hypothetical protein